MYTSWMIEDEEHIIKMCLKTDSHSLQSIYKMEERITENPVCSHHLVCTGQVG